MAIKTKFLIPIIIVVVLIIAGVILALVLSGYKTPFQKQPEIAKEIYGVSGTIEEIRTSSLIINALISYQDPSLEPKQANVEAAVNNETKIYTLKFPDPNTLTKKQLESGVQPKITEIKFADLKKGDKVDISAKENISENIKNNSPFTADVINVVK